jgi:hypothetical protein
VEEEDAALDAIYEDSVIRDEELGVISIKVAR